MAVNRRGYWRGAAFAAFIACAGLMTSGCVIDAATTVVEDRQFGHVISDTETRMNITKRLLAAENNDLFFDVHTDTYEGRVMLTGAVKTPRDRERAAALVHGLPGVKIVYNEIQVTDKGGFESAANDFWIDTKILTKMVAEQDIKSVNLRWRVVNGTVYLLGFARSEKERQIAIALAKDTQYVTRVIDHIAVR